uniref:Uncharacterized protein n=1 Tax=Meloidogyne javanica TaxID=6303 RepID=A0A915N3V4_MELJA
MGALKANLPRSQKEASSSETKILNQKFDKHRCPKGEQKFEIGEIVEVKNKNKFTGGTEWLLARIVKIENGGYEVRIMNSRLFGAIANDNFQIDEIVELKKSNEWISGKIIGKEEGRYIVRIESGYRCGKIFRRYPNELRECPKGELRFEIGEVVELNNWNKITGETEWLLARIVKIENGGYEAQIMNSRLFGAKFFCCSNDIRKYSSSANDTFQINETVELKNYNEWILGKIIGKEAGKYIISVLSGHRYGMIFRRYSEELRKYDSSKDLKHYEIGEIIEVKNFDQQTKETNWIKAKILEINQRDNCRLEVVDKCKLKGVVFNRNIYSMRKFKIENFQVGEQVEVCIYDNINDKTEWVKAIILEKLNGMYILGMGTNILEEYPCNIRKIKSG